MQDLVDGRDMAAITDALRDGRDGDPDVVIRELYSHYADGCQGGQRWAGWTALLIGVASAPQAAASGFGSPYTIPDMATTALGMLLAITILATAGRTGRRDTTRQIPACWTREPRGDPPGSTP